MPSPEITRRIKHKLWEETVVMLWLFLYLFLFLAGLAGYRATLLGKDGTGAWPLFHCAIEAMVLAKVMVIGNALRLGERVYHPRMIVRVLYRSVAFGVFALVVSGLEELARGLWNGEAFSDLIHQALEVNPRLLAARMIVQVVFFLPLFAIWAVSRKLGPSTLRTMFFETEPAQASPDYAD
ncbi:MAG: hypothetical protein ACREJD_12335 [Phycisphaerales bacterium]